MTETNTEVTKTYGIKELKEVVKFGIDMGEAADKSLVDGKIGLEDATHFFTALMGIGKAFDGIKDVPNEVKDLDAAERAELLAYVQDEFDIANDKIETVIEKALAVVLSIYEIVEVVRTMKEEKVA